MNPRELQQELQYGENQDLKRRRAIIGLSLVGIAALGAVTLLQTGIIKHLPDPPVDGFDSDKVNSSETAYMWGAPDGTLGVANFAANLPLAAFGGENRAEEQPLAPLVAAGKAAADALVGAWYFYQMPAKEHAWCPYCITAALCQFGVFALSVPEARTAWRTLQQGKPALPPEQGAPPKTHELRTAAELARAASGGKR